ncbi:MAG: hypothetical protein SGJ19_11755 [Planctomycetia bacterium]|nr:hypothetical protein [Planctomycetia bacterium]
MQRFRSNQLCALMLILAVCVVAGCGPAEPPEAAMFREMEARDVIVKDGKLTELNFGSQSFSDADCAKLAALSDLQVLDLGKCQITDAGLDQVAKLITLDSLSLEGVTAITDAGIAKLSPLKTLTNLNLGGTGVTDESLESIAKLPALQKLSLAPAPAITDAGLSQLDGLKQLNEIWLVGTGVTAEGAKSLKAAHPGILVHGVDEEEETESEIDSAAEKAPSPSS